MMASWNRNCDGGAAIVELSRTARDHSTSSDNANSLEPTVVVRIRSSKSVIGCPVSQNNLLLFVHQPSTIERALRGKAFESTNDDVASETLQKLPHGRFGFVGHVINQPWVLIQCIAIHAPLLRFRPLHS